MSTDRNPSSTLNLRIPPPTIAISRRETIAFPIELGASSGGIVGYSKTTDGDTVTVRCIWSGRFTDLSTDQFRVERELRDSGYELGARIADATIYMSKARLVDATGASVAPMFIPRWSADLRMSGETLVSVGANKAIRLSVQPSPVCVPPELLGRVDDSYHGRAPWTVTASSSLTLHSLDAERIARASDPVLQLELLIRAIAVPEV